MTRSRILIVEDDETLRDTIADVVSDDGNDVRLASDGHEALDQVRRWRPDLVILDLMMPRMNAHEFRATQLETAVGPLPRILVVSAATDLEAAAERLHADAWLAKPFTLDAMIDTVNRLLDLGPAPPPNELRRTEGATEPSPF